MVPKGAGGSRSSLVGKDRTILRRYSRLMASISVLIRREQPKGSSASQLLEFEIRRPRDLFARRVDCRHFKLVRSGA
jgi:hypothetical protein